MDADQARRATLAATAPLCALCAALALYATLACPALERWSMEFCVLAGLPAAVLVACGITVYGVAVDRRRIAAVAVLAAVLAIAGWIRLAAYGPVFQP